MYNFWNNVNEDTKLSQSINDLMAKDSFTLKEVVEHEDFTNELRDNRQLIEYIIGTPENLHQLIDIITRKPKVEEMTDHNRCFKLPQVVCEIFADNDEILLNVMHDTDYLDYFFSFVKRKGDYKLSILCGQFGKVVKKMLELKPKAVLDYVVKDDRQVLKDLVQLLHQQAICELIQQILNTADAQINNCMESSLDPISGLTDETPEALQALAQQEKEINQERLWVCMYIFERISHGHSDSTVLHSANIIINTVNKMDSKFSLDLVEELQKTDYFERLLRNIIPFKYKIDYERNKLEEISSFSVSCMKTSISVVFNLVQIYINNKARMEQEETASEGSKDDDPYSSREKEKAPQRELPTHFLHIIVKQIPFLVSVLRQFDVVDEQALDKLTKIPTDSPQGKEVYELNVDVQKQFNSNRIDLPSGTFQPLGLERFRLVSFLGKIIQLNHTDINQELYNSKQLDTLLKMMWYFENNTIMHNTLTAIFKQILKNESSLLLLWGLLVESNFVNELLDQAFTEFEASKDGKNNQKAQLPHLISITTEISTKIKETIIFQKQLGMLHTPLEQMAGRHRSLCNSSSLLNQVDEYLGKSLDFDFTQAERNYNFTLTYHKWVDFEENVLLKQLESEAASIPDTDEYKILHDIVKKSLGTSASSSRSPQKSLSSALGLEQQISHNPELQIYKNQVERFSSFSNAQEEQEGFERDQEMTLEDGAFNFKENLDDADEQLRLPEDIFNKFTHDRKGSNDSDDIVKQDMDSKFDFSPEKNCGTQDFETTDQYMKRKSGQNFQDSIKMMEENGTISPTKGKEEKQFSESNFWKSNEHVQIDDEELNDLL